MAIQLPEVKRIEPDQPQSVGRIQANVPDPRADLQSQQTGINNIAEQAIKYRNDIAHQTADTIATDASNKFDSWYKQQMYGDPENGVVGIKFQEGNPTDLFKDFDKQAQDKLDELSQSKDWSTETQNLVNRRMSRKAQELHDQSLTEYGSQQTKYDNGITEARVKLSSEAMPGLAATIDPESIAKGDLSTLGPVQNKISEIQNARIAQALRLKGAVLDPNGETAYTDEGGQEHRVTLGPVTKQKIKEDLSKALHDTTDNLIKSGADDPAILAKAKVMMDQFGQHIEPLKQGGIQAEFVKAQVKNQAFQLAGDGGHMTPDQFEKSIQGASYQVQAEARKIKADNSRNMETDRRNQQELNYRAAYQQAIQFKQANPSATETQLEQQPFFAHLESKMDPKDIKAVKEVFNPPRVTDETSRARVASILRGEVDGLDPKNMTGDQINKEMIGLNENDRNFYGKQFSSATSEKTAKQFTANTRAVLELKAQAIRAGEVKYDARDGTRNFEPGKQNDVKFGAMQTAFTKSLQTINAGGDLNPAELKDEAAKFLTDWKTNTPYVPPKKAFRGSGPAFGAAANAAAAKTPISQADINTAGIKGYKAMNNGKQPNAAQLKDYISLHFNSDGSAK